MTIAARGTKRSAQLSTPYGARVSDVEPDIICERRGHAGVVILNRPRALNALTHGMVRGLAKALDDFEADPAVHHVVVTGAGEKAFCAGGDIRQLYELGRAGRFGEARGFWREEYALNQRIKTYSKPYVAIMDGIVMGGGVGVSLHGSHRIAGDRYLFAMPEVGIGFFPDVGATWALPRLPGATGTWLAVTGDRVGQADAVELGLATHAIASAQISQVLDALVAGQPVDTVLAAAAVEMPPAPVRDHRTVIDMAFSADSVEGIIERLGSVDTDPFAARMLAGLSRKSPLSMKLALAQMRAGATLGFAEAMRLEFRIVSRIVHGTDFYEGVRAVIIDKDNAPRWQPATLADVSDALIAGYLAPLPDDLVV